MGFFCTSALQNLRQSCKQLLVECVIHLPKGGGGGELKTRKWESPLHFTFAITLLVTCVLVLKTFQNNEKQGIERSNDIKDMVVGVCIYIPWNVHITFSEIGYIKVIYLIKRYVKQLLKQNSPFVKDTKNLICQKVQILQKIFLLF